MTKTGGIAAAQLKSIVQRIERLEEEKKALADDIRDVYAEAKANGFDVATIRAVVKLRKMDKAEREEAQSLLDLYLHALGMLPDQDESATELETAAGAKTSSGKGSKRKTKGDTPTSGVADVGHKDVAAVTPPPLS